MPDVNLPDLSLPNVSESDFDIPDAAKLGVPGASTQSAEQDSGWRRMFLETAGRSLHGEASFGLPSHHDSSERLFSPAPRGAGRWRVAAGGSFQPSWWLATPNGKSSLMRILQRARVRQKQTFRVALAGLGPGRFPVSHFKENCCVTVVVPHRGTKPPEEPVDLLP